MTGSSAKDDRGFCPCASWRRQTSSVSAGACDFTISNSFYGIVNQWLFSLSQFFGQIHAISMLWCSHLRVINQIWCWVRLSLPDGWYRCSSQCCAPSTKLWKRTIDRLISAVNISQREKQRLCERLINMPANKMEYFIIRKSFFFFVPKEKFLHRKQKAVLCFVSYLSSGVALTKQALQEWELSPFGCPPPLQLTPIFPSSNPD